MTENALMGLCPDCLLRAGFGTIDSRGETAEKPAPFVPPTPEELARYFPELEIIELLGRGGMGAVYKVRQKRLERLVALKILPPNVGQDPSFAERFEREAKALAQLHHPNIVTLYDSGQVDGLFYFFMEFVDGMNLRQMLDTGHISPREALAIVPQICDALQFAHDRGIIHRDIKPENILLNKEGRVKIADFGVAKIVAYELSETTGGGTAAPELGRTEAGKVIGTPQYMAPEQLSHPLDVDNRADIYALGVVFYQMLTGELPVGKFERPSNKAQIDVRLDEVVLRALEKKPELRYQQVSEVKTMVETIASRADIPTVGLGVAPGSASGRTDAPRFSRMAIMGVVLALLLLMVLLSVFIPARWSAWALNSTVNPKLADASHSEPNAVRQIKNALFVASLNQGEVELAAIGNMPWTNPVCWLPDGQPSVAPFPLDNNFAISNWAENMEIKKIAFYIRNESAEGISTPICRISQESGAQPGSSAWDAPDSRTPNGHFAQIIVCPKGALTMNISLGVANGTWETAITLKHENNFSGGEADGDWSATWQAVTGKEGDVAVSCSYKKNEDWESRMVYVDDTEKVIPIQENSSHVGNGQTGATLPVSSSEFARIKEFRLQRRKYQWVEFRNVSLQPGHATTVEVRDFGDENQSAQTMPTTPAAAQNLTFGPVMERTLYDYKSGKDWLLNLETGETFSLPAGVDWDRNASAVWEWMHQHGIHVMGFTAFSQHWHEGDPVPVIQTLDHGYGLPVASKRGLYGFEMKAAIIQKKDIAFETITPLQISNALQWQVSPANGNSNAGPWLSQFAGMAWHDVAWHGLDDYLYAFQTDDGQGGVLQITGFTENPRAVKIRYKVVQSSVTTVTPVSLPPANAQNPSFGPVIERTIYDYKSGKDWLLNLETGESFSLPPGLDWDRNAAAVWEWAHQHGVHVTGLPVVSQQALYGFEMKAAIVREPNLTFEAITPLQISKALQGPLVTQSSHNDGPILFQLAGMDWQNLYAFLTNDGQSGLLQVIGMTENPPGVKIRYKVVLSSVTTVTPLSLPPADAQSPSFGPVMEHVLPADKDGLTPLFDLDHDKLVPDPGPGDTTGGLARLFSSGVAVMRDEAKGQTVLMGMGGGTVTESVRPEQWDTMTAAEAALLAMNSFLGHPGMGVITSAVAPGKLPQTFLFKTSSGKIGLWQVEEFTDNPHSVKIRYKLVQNAVETGNSLSWLLEEKPPIVSAMKNPVETPHFPLAGEAVGFADFDGEFHPVMFLAAPIPRGGSEVPASSLPPSRDSTLTLDIYRGTNPLATANHFLGEFQITTPSADAGLEIGFRLTQSGQLYLDVSDRDKNVTLEGNRIRAADPTDKQNTIRYKLVR